MSFAVSMESGVPTRRWEITDAQRIILEKSYTDNPFPDLSCRKFLSLELNVTPRQIQVWFQNRRQKERAKKNNAGPKKSAPHSSPTRTASPSPDEQSDQESQPTSPSPRNSSPINSLEAAAVAAPVPAAAPAVASLASLLASANPHHSALSGFGDLLGRGLLNRPPIASLAASLGLPNFKFGNPLNALHTQQLGSLMNAPRHDISLERSLASQLRGLVRPLSDSASIFRQSPIAKRPPAARRYQGVPMDRRSISMDAIEVLSSQFS